MPEDQCILCDDARATFAILDQCRSLGSDCKSWLNYLISGLAELIHANGCGRFVSSTSDDPSSNDTVGIEARHLHADSLSQCDPSQLLAIGPSSPDDRGRILERSQSSMDQPVAVSDESYSLIGLVRTGQDTADFLVVFFERPTDGSAFTKRERALVRFALEAAAQLVERTLSGPRDKSHSPLAPRVREVLKWLLHGESDKRISLRLGISTHTVQQYCKTLFAFYEVNSRAELMARWIERGWTNELPP